MAPASLPGYKVLKDRRALNVATGEIISRRQFDKLSGRLGSFSSYEAKAKANKIANPTLASSRPARGRASTIKNTFINKGRNIKSSKDRKFSDFIIPIYYVNEEANLKRAYGDFKDFIEGLKNNPRAFSVVTQIIFEQAGEQMVRNLIPAIRWPTVSQLGVAVEEFKLSYEYKPDEDLVLAFSMHVIFRSEYMKTL